MRIKDLRKNEVVDASLEIALDILLNQLSMHGASVELHPDGTVPKRIANVFFDGCIFGHSRDSWKYDLPADKKALEDFFYELFMPYTAEGLIFGIKHEGDPCSRNYAVIANLPVRGEHIDYVLQRFEQATDVPAEERRRRQFCFD